MECGTKHSKCSANLPSDISSHEERIRCVDQCLMRFSESATCTRYPHTLSGKTLFSADGIPSTADITSAYSPLTLEKQFQDLYRLLRPALLPAVSESAEQSQKQSRTNVSAFVQGTRGSGKTLLLNQVLAALRDEIFERQNILEGDCSMFRVVHINGLLVPGHSVNNVVREILVQLSDSALRETAARKRAKVAHTENVSCGNDEQDDKHVDHVGELLRLKQTSFTNQLQLLSEIIQVACVDNIPFLFVLDELDTFLGMGARGGVTSIDSTGAGFVNQDRQVLLYHLLDRVATQGSLCSLVGLTCDTGIMTRLEKRIKSRAEGTAKFFLTGPCRTYEDLTNILCEKVYNGPIDGSTEAHLKQEVMLSLQKPSGTTDRPQQRLYEAFLRDYRLGKDLRWFSRVLYYALVLYRDDLVHPQRRSSAIEDHGMLSNECIFSNKYLEEALVDMGGSFAKDKVSMVAQSKSNQVAPTTDRRLQALGNCQGPAVALILSARRILYRDGSSCHRTIQNEASQTQLPSLTLNRMLHEYKSFYKGQAANYSERLLRKAFDELIRVSVFRPAVDHSGGSSLQYHHRDDLLYNYSCLDVVDRMPLHMLLDIHREVKPAIDHGTLTCATSLREWGRTST